ncbi:MAG: DUF4351 domain-containing protein, partial [Patescibacteria group bacterium]|nr:DUF4351 domain-containing protein [Patescibacteria group bacterium]
IETYMPLTGPERVEFEQLVAVDQVYVEVEEMITVYEQRGIEKGIEKGRQEGRQETLLLQLERKFGSLPEEVKERVRRIQSAERLDALLVAVLDAKALDDLPF